VNAYVYMAELLCEPCGENVRLWKTIMREAPADPKDESSYDSDDYPKGPYPDGGGEADCAQHCGLCGVALDNPVITYEKEETTDTA